VALKAYLENAIGKTGCVMMNGTGGSAPALDENADWPTRYTLIRDRSLVWRAQAGGAGPQAGVYKFDYDFGSAVNIGAAGFMNLRVHPPSQMPGTVSIEAYSGSSYPPSTAASLALTASASNNLKEFGPVSARYWRVQVTAPNNLGAPLEISGKPWLVENANITTLLNPHAPDSIIRSEVLRFEVPLGGGARHSYVPDDQARATLTRTVGLSYPISDGTLVTYMRDTVSQSSMRVVFQDYEGNFLEADLPDEGLTWERVFGTANSLSLPLVAAT